MLQVKNIYKEYKTGELVQKALNDVSLTLRDSEFVAILGPSGSGKTTLLNIVGGLDRYDSGDLIVNRISTKKYKDRDWDSYRNHTIGFVFQSYNLIPHQSILANVELALTISGISGAERKKRAAEALDKVGLGNQLHKKPNQLSGGQMQRVAIARALVNDPEVLLADEPTGALDSETSVQIMELLKEVAKDRLVVMVTHNPELAEAYATRIVKLRDGKIISDTDPFQPKESDQPAVHKNMGKAAMSFFTALSLSFNNLKTKKGRTLLTAFAGSIGIVGIALILSLSTGVNQYITDIQKETMASYPISIQAKTVDMSSLIQVRDRVLEQTLESTEADDTHLHASYFDIESVESMQNSVTENDLTAFKAYLDDPNSEIQPYIGENGVVYTYDVGFEVFAQDEEGRWVNTNTKPDSSTGKKTAFGGMGNMKSMAAMFGAKAGTTGAENFTQLMPASDGSAVSQVEKDSYDLVCGSWPEEYDQVVLVLNQSGTLYTEQLYQLGLITAEEYDEIKTAIENQESPAEKTWAYTSLLQRTFSLVPACDFYQKGEDGLFTAIDSESLLYDTLPENGLTLKVVGVIRPVGGASNATITTPVAYTAKLTDYVIRYSDESEIIRAQEADPSVNVLTGMAFTAPTEAEKVEDAKAFVSQMSITDKASLYTMILYYAAAENQNTAPTEVPDAAGMAAGGYDPSAMAGGAPGGMGSDEVSMAQAMDLWLENTPDETVLLSLYDQYIEGATYEDNMHSFGKTSYDAPSSINIYTDSFESKNAISDCIEHYNASVDEEQKITYTDYVALLTSSITSIVDVISYVLIAFVAVSLVVSCIMIGIITHISVLERTKEIGILRALGASKRNISQVFNAETVIIGFCAGLLGVGVSMLLTIPINAVIQTLVGSDTVRAFLPVTSAVLLVIISMIITVIGGLLPARKAAKKDPVLALRSE